MPKRKVKLTYFKQSGKYYSEDDSYVTEKDALYEIWDEIRDMMAKGKRPGLVDGYNDFYVWISVPGHPHDHPHLLIPPELKKEVERDLCILQHVKPW